MLAPAQRQAILDDWHSGSQAAWESSRKAGLSPHETAVIQAKALRFGSMMVKMGLMENSHHLLYSVVQPEEVIAALEAGEFDTEIATILGYQ
jgi:hypothetical protein